MAHIEASLELEFQLQLYRPAVCQKLLLNEYDRLHLRPLSLLHPKAGVVESQAVEVHLGYGPIVVQWN
ncbi:hypothetical protein D3C81_2188600 [compost metagenome]